MSVIARGTPCKATAKAPTTAYSIPSASSLWKTARLSAKRSIAIAGILSHDAGLSRITSAASDISPVESPPAAGSDF